jgi:hypothetical protein
MAKRMEEVVSNGMMGPTTRATSSMVFFMDMEHTISKKAKRHIQANSLRDV